MNKVNISLQYLFISSGEFMILDQLQFFFHQNDVGRDHRILGDEAPSMVHIESKRSEWLELNGKSTFLYCTAAHFFPTAFLAFIIIEGATDIKQAVNVGESGQRNVELLGLNTKFTFMGLNRNYAFT